MGVPGSSRPTTFNLSQVYRALGMRDPRVMPNVAAGSLTPTIQLGQLESFAAEVIEARGVVNSGPHNVLAGQWVALAQQATSPGGVIIESTRGSNVNITWNLAPTRPFTANPVIPFSIGGQLITSLFEDTGAMVGPFPLGSALGGSNTPVQTFGAEIVERAWIPPGWWFWSVMFQGTSNYSQWRFREIPEMQGPA